MLIHRDPNNMNSIVYHLIIERYSMKTLHWYFPWETALDLYNMTGRGEKLQQLHCYHPFSDSLDIYLTKNRYENYSPKMVPISKIGGLAHGLKTVAPSWPDPDSLHSRWSKATDSGNFRHFESIHNYSQSMIDHGKATETKHEQIQHFHADRFETTNSDIFVRPDSGFPFHCVP